MSNRTAPRRILFFGTPCALSVWPLARLLADRQPVCAVVTPAAPGQGEPVHVVPPPRRPLLRTPTASLPHLCQQAGIPLLRVRGLRQRAVQEALAAFAAELFVVSCFPWRVPAALLATARHGGLNLHPALLPDGRGPDPLFWLYRRGALRTGLTLHQLTDELDAGPIVAQQTVDVPLGLPGDQLERLLGQLGGWLLARALADLPAALAAARPQDERRARFDPLPSPADWTVTPDWPAWRAVHFLRGVIPLGYRPLLVWPGAAPVPVARLIAWAASPTHARAYAVAGAQFFVCHDGVLVVQRAETPS